MISYGVYSSQKISEVPQEDNEEAFSLSEALGHERYDSPKGVLFSMYKEHKKTEVIPKIEKEIKEQIERKLMVGPASSHFSDPRMAALSSLML